MTPKCSAPPGQQVALVDVFMDPSCWTTNRDLLTPLLAALPALNDAAVQLSITPFTTNTYSPNSKAFAFHIEISQVLLCSQFPSYSRSAVRQFLKCFFIDPLPMSAATTSLSKIVQQASLCDSNTGLSPNDGTTTQFLQCMRNDTSVIDFAQFQAEYYLGQDSDVMTNVNPPYVFINGTQTNVCASPTTWTTDGIVNALCTTTYLGMPNRRVTSPTDLWYGPVADVYFTSDDAAHKSTCLSYDASCSATLLANGGDASQGTGGGGGTSASFFSDFLPIVGLFLLTMSSITLVCSIIARRRVRGARDRNRRMFRAGAGNNAGGGGISEQRINEIILLLSSLNLANNEQLQASRNRHKQDVDRSLGLLPARIMDAGVEGAVCAVCLEDVVEYLHLPCEHVFHPACLKEWLYSDKSDCPVCRGKIVDEITPFSSGDGQNSAPQQQQQQQQQQHNREAGTGNGGGVIDGMMMV